MKNFKRRSDDSKTSYRDYFMLNYVIVASMFSILLFLYGFFPLSYNDHSIATRKDIPKFIERTRVKMDEVYKPVVKKVIIMVIDAMRWDFISGPNSAEYMPMTHDLLKRKEGCLYKTKVNPPTVTMPRIKAKTTGSVPNFIEVVLNLGATEILGDSILRQTKYQGHKIIFYGDDTWLKLFPDIFDRYEGTSSFYVSDYTEVDFNVTRNVAIELHKKDWSIMVLHYLGLDHIGHIAGPFSPLIKPKLQEMDNVIGNIEFYVSEWNKNREETVFIVCGDHGMKDSGGHGGATLEETLVPLMVFGKSCSNKKNPNDHISQIDIAPTLSVLLGTPIPSTSLGTIVLDLMTDLSLSQKLFALYYNAEQLFLKYQKFSDYQYTGTYKNYQNAIKLHAAWLNTNSQPNDMVDDIIIMYQSAIMDMKKRLTSNLLEYDVQVLTLAIIFMGQILYISTSTEKSTPISYKQFLTIFVASYMMWMFMNQIFDSGTTTVLFSQRLDLHFLFVTIPIFGILALNCYLCATRAIASDKTRDWPDLQCLLMIGTLSHTISLASSSFVEEEHQTWYYYWITLVTFFAFYHFRKNINAKQKSFKLLAKLMLLLVSHRILRKLNSTGDKYAHLPDISGWLQNRPCTIEMTTILLFGLGLLIWLDYIYEDEENRPIVLLLDSILAILVYLRHAIADTVFLPSFYFDSRGLIEMYYFWAFTLIYIVHSIYRLGATKRHNKEKYLCLSLFLLVKKWVIVSSILHRPYNVILLPMQLIVGATIFELTNEQEFSNAKLFIYLWCSNVFYFYQGNSNSLATVDVAAGYVGLESHQPVITGIFISINTYSAQILGFLMYLWDYALQYPRSTSKSMLLLCRQYAFWRLVPITFYAAVTSFQRYHLFVWSVFSPKLLYEAMHCAVLLSVMFLLQFHFILCDRVRARKV
ncbi:GPI ethanolamine phosphate transferase 2 [Nasonia vitripennis]|uniref:GPI ethanolamine phosphate transferase 2 C-terminal domain-containing protein n=1 Tax=Nasonia vitripennis TaxID=7425 RepID=A0A7M7G856_NASVI|nr:GPI ethanolamine phosphate transferase 2 [Nasonia vitripennis]